MFDRIVPSTLRSIQFEEKGRMDDSGAFDVEAGTEVTVCLLTSGSFPITNATLAPLQIA